MSFPGFVNKGYQVLSSKITIFIRILLIFAIFVEKQLFSSVTASDSRKLARPYMFRMVINSVIASNRDPLLDSSG